MIQTVIFDIDGTIVDSNELHIAAWDRAFREFGKEFSREQLHEQVGKGSDQYLPAFLNPNELKTLGPKIDKYRTELYAKEYLPQVRPFPKVRELFERIRRDGKRIALASSGKKQELSFYKEITKIGDLVDSETMSDDVDQSKPAADVFAAALKKLHDPSPAEVIAVGDTPYDAEAAQKIGIATIGLLCGGFAEAKLREAGMIAIYRDLADLLVHYDECPISKL